MSTLTPTQAAVLARGVYKLRENSVSDMRERGQTLGCEGMFTVDDGSRFQGKSGALAWKRLSGFGYMAAGEGAHQGEVLLVTRGTAMGADWVTNLNIGMQSGPSGHFVHAGFNETWKSFSTEIRGFLQGRNPSTIHCVGHSLGGALATLNADLLSSIGAGQVKLYTFGCPRTGVIPFSRALTRRVGSANIHRVFHHSDPVPMIPIFPFQHLPTDTAGLGITSADAGLISVAAHNMEGSYIPGVEGLSWQDLAAAQGNPNTDQQTQSWLEQAAAGRGNILMGSAKALGMIGRALRWVLKQAGKLLVGVFGTVLTVGASLVDQLAWLLGKAADLSKELGGHVKTLVMAIMKFLGKSVKAIAEASVAFLRWVLELLFSTLRNTAERALQFIGS